MTNKALVAVCDILGFGDLVKYKPLQEIIDGPILDFKGLLDTLSKYRRLIGHVVFSDTVLIYSLSDDRHGYDNVIYVVTHLLAHPILYPMLRFRIGISYGDFYHSAEENIYVGKALIEAHELEKRQEWCGGALTEVAEERIKSEQCGLTYLTKYDVPTKGGKTESLLVINWTKAKHNVTDKQDSWLDRGEIMPILAEEKRVKIERYLKNTEQFHFDTCVPCKAHRNRLIKMEGE